MQSKQIKPSRIVSVHLNKDDDLIVLDNNGYLWLANNQDVKYNHRRSKINGIVDWELLLKPDYAHQSLYMLDKLPDGNFEKVDLSIEDGIKLRLAFSAIQKK